MPVPCCINAELCLTTAALYGNQLLLAEHSTLSDELFYNIAPTLFALSKIADMAEVRVIRIW